jgi:hypothetical protein
MLQLFLLAMLATVLILPPLVLSKRGATLRWRTRHLLAALPGAVTGIGWQLGKNAPDYFSCQGGFKNLHSCFLGGLDVTSFVGFVAFFPMIAFFYVALPLSLWLSLNTAAKQIGEWHRRTQRSGSAPDQ